MKTRLLCIVLVIVLCVGMLPVGALAAEEEPTTEALTEETVETSTEETTEEATEETESPSTTETEESAEETTEETVEETTEESVEKTAEGKTVETAEETESASTTETEEATVETTEEVPLPLDGDSETAASGTCGENLTWTLDSDGVLTISGTGDMTDYTKSSSVPWYSERKSITSAVIADGVTGIGEYAFYSCDSLTSVTIPDGVASIGAESFRWCTKLASITIPASVTSIGKSAFEYCNRLADVYYAETADKWNAINIESGNECLVNNFINGVASGTCGDEITWKIVKENGILVVSGAGDMPTFSSSMKVPWSYCSAYITTAVIEDTVTSIEQWSFDYCTNLTSVTIGNGVTSMAGSLFRNCASLTTITVDENNSAYTSQNGVLFNKDMTELICYPRGCSGTYTIPDSVERIEEYAFYYCGSLTSVTIPDGVTSIGNFAFDYCDSLTSITIPDSVTTIGEYAFSGCAALENVTIGDGVTSIGKNAFSGCKALENVTIGDSVTSIGNYAFYYCGNLTSITIPDSVTTIGEDAFYGCTALESVTIGSGVTSIGSYAFKGCTALMSITVPDSVTTIEGYAFYECDALESVTIGDGVTSIGSSAFNGCTALKSVMIGSGEASIGSSAFYGCTALESVTIGDGVTTIGKHAFSGCSALESITIPDSVTTIGEYAFNGCTALESVTIGSGVTSIGNSAFLNCTSLVKVDYHGSESNWDKISIGSKNTCLTDAVLWFDGLLSGTCGDDLTWVYGEGILTISGTGKMTDYDVPWSSVRTSITTVVIEDGVTSIGGDAFENCTALTSVTIPISVTRIGYDAFRTCISLTNVNYPGTEADWNKISIGSGNDYLKNAYIPSGVCGENVGWIYDDGILTIFGTGEMTEYSCFDEVPWQSKSARITAVVIEDGVTSIGDYAFCECTKLGSLTFPDSVTSIGDYAFYECSSLESLTYTGSSEPENVIEIGCGNAYMSYLYACMYTSIYDDFTGSGILNGGLVWVLDNDGTFAISGVGDMPEKADSGWPWASEKALIAAVVIEDGVTSIGWGAFSGCTSLASITIPDSVTSIGNFAFYGCTSLESITLPDGVTSIGYDVFHGCTSLVSITIPDGVTTIGEYAFYNCASLTSIEIGNGVERIGTYTFRDCKALTSIVLPDGVATIDKNAFWGCTSLESVTIPDSLTSVDEYAFYGCSSLVDVYYAGSMEQWAAISISEYNNTHLTNAFINGVASGTCGSDLVWTLEKESGVLTISGTGAMMNSPWDGKESYVKAVVLENGVTSIGSNSFSGCSNLTSAMIPNSVTSIGYNAFHACSSLTSITIPDGVTSIDNYVFSECTGLTNVTIGTGLESIGYGAFSGCSAITSVTYAGTEEDWDAIDNDGGNYYLTSAYLNGLNSGSCGDNLTWSLDNGTLTISGTGKMMDFYTYDGSAWYHKRSSITAVVIEDGVTNVSSYAFYDCEALVSVTIPESVTAIGESAFAGCEALANVYYAGSKSDWNKIDMEDGNYYYLSGASIQFGKVSTGFEAITYDAEIFDGNVVLSGSFTKTIAGENYQCCLAYESSVEALEAGTASVNIQELDGEAVYEHYFRSGIGVFLVPGATYYYRAEIRYDWDEVVAAGKIKSFVAPQLTLPTITVGKTITFSGEENYYSFTPTADGVYRIDFGVNAYANVYDSTGAWIASGYKSDESSTDIFDMNAVFVAKVGQTYYIEAHSLNYEDDTASLHFTLEREGYASEFKAVTGEAKIDGDSVTLSGTFTKPATTNNYTCYILFDLSEEALFAESTLGMAWIGYDNEKWDAQSSSSKVSDTWLLVPGVRYYYCSAVVYSDFESTIVDHGTIKSFVAPERSFEKLTLDESKTLDSWDVAYCCFTPTYDGTYTVNLGDGGSADIYDSTGTKIAWGYVDEGYPEESQNATFTAKGGETYYIEVLALSDSSIRYSMTCDFMHIHVWDSGVVTTEPTCTEKGVKTYTCSDCGDTKTEEIAASGHDWNDGEVTKTPTIASEGEMTYTCANCGGTKTEQIERLTAADVLDSIDEAASPEAIRDAVQEIGVEDLAKALEDEDSGVLEKLGELEVSVKSGEITVKTESTVDSVKCVSVTGAALNDLAEDNTDNTITLTITAADAAALPEDFSAEGAMYLDITLEGVANPHKLEVPVVLTLAVPEDMNTSLLRIIHYKEDTDGKVVEVETLVPTVFQGEDGQWYARFVVTGFSTFVLAQLLRVPGDFNGDGHVTIIDVLALLKHVAGISELSGNLDVNNDGDVNILDVLHLLKFVAGIITEL